MTEPYDREQYAEMSRIRIERLQNASILERERQRQREMRRKKFWIYFVESSRWVIATEIGFDKARSQGRPVRRSIMTPHKSPDFIFERCPICGKKCMGCSGTVSK